MQYQINEDFYRTMISPLKLSVIVCGAAVGLAVAPFVVKQILPPDEKENVAAAGPSDPVSSEPPVTLDLPVVAPKASVVVASAPVEPITNPVKELATPAAELHLSTPALPSPAPVAPTPAPAVASSPELTLPSLSQTAAPVQVATAAMPSPSITPKPVVTPSPTPEIPYRSEVETAQKLMRELGLSTGKVDGKLGPYTQAAVRDFQKSHKLPATGDVNLDLVAAMEKAVATKAKAAETAKIEIADAKPADDAKKPAPADDPAALIVRKSNDDKASSKETAVAQAFKPKVDPGPVPNLQNQPNVKKLQEQLKLAGTYDGPVDGRWGDLTRTAMREFQEKAGIEVTGKPNKETWLAMHSEAVRPAEAKTIVTASAKKESPKATDEELKISSADSTPDASTDNAALVVNVNGDGVSDPDLAEPIATPSAVSSLNSDKKAEPAGSPEKDAKVTVSVPARSNKSSSDSDEKPSDLAVASDDDEVRLEKLRKEIEQRRTKIESVSNDSTYEVKKYAPKMLETVSSMVDNFKIESVSNNPSEARERLAKIDEELERAKKESMKKKAGQTVENVRDSYDALKKSFPSRIKCLSLKDKEEKSKREELTELVAKIDLGFEAMQKDYTKGNYEPIFKNGRDFCATIDEINRTVADVYVSTTLEQKETKSKLDDKALTEIKSMQKSEQHVKAADKLDGLLSSSSSKKKS